MTGRVDTTMDAYSIPFLYTVTLSAISNDVDEKSAVDVIRIYRKTICRGYRSLRFGR